MAKARVQSVIGDEAVTKATGKNWDHWFRVLDRFDVAQHGHKAAAVFLAEKHQVSPWWSQSVVVRYEQVRGLRDKLQKADGYSASGSRTLAASVDQVYQSWNEPRRRKNWLPENLTIRKATENKSLRITWSDGTTHVDVYLYDKGPGKCQITVQHSKLASSDEAQRLKEFWAEKLDELKARVERGRGR